MVLEHRLEIKLLQKLILTPQLQQAIKLLQLPQLELSQTLNTELTENPFLEEVTEEMNVEEEEKALPATENQGDKPAPDDTEAPLEQVMGLSVGEYFDTRSFDGRDLGYFSPDTGQSQSLEQYVSESSDLYDHLTWQLRFCQIRQKLHDTAESVIGNINENGYLEATDEEIASYSDCSVKCAQEAIELVQAFDPIGVGAKDLKECLTLQLGPLDLRGSLVEELIQNNLGDIEKRKYQQLARQYACTLDEIKKAVTIITGLEPKPGREFSNTQPIYIKPDVYVVRTNDGFQIRLNDDNVPHIRINSYYRKLLSNRDSLQKDEKAYLDERLRSAVWLLKSLDHRNKTIYRVTDCILKFQKGFFEQGVMQLRPLNLKDIAQELSLHESTISRATSNKYLSCSHGLFNFRFFFSSGLNTLNGKVSSTSVKDMIKKIVSEENHIKPLSDLKISEMLKSFDIKVARRTVAKYREEMHIPAHSMRKQYE